MSTVVLQAGQCGNQLGFELLDLMYSNTCPSDDTSVEQAMDLDLYFRTSASGKPIARAVLVDTEPKVVDGVFGKSQHCPWSYGARNSIVQQSGAGNNWAMGYNMCTGSFLDDITDTVRREIEACDVFGGIVLVQSLGGGTGSGCGTRLSQQLRYEYPGRVLACLVSPYHFGEVIVQHYNCLLGLAHVADDVSCAVFDNEVARQVCRKMMHLPSPSIHQINRVIASHLAAFLLPKVDVNGRRCYLSKDLAHLTPNPRYPFFDIRLTPQAPSNTASFTYDSWEAIARTLYSMSACDVFVESELAAALRARTGRTTSLSVTDRPSVHNTSIAAQTIFRGRDSSEHGTIHPDMFSAWNDQPHQCVTSPRPAFGYARSGAIASNSQAILPILERTVTRAADLYKVSAYVHSYEKEGFEHDNFQHAFLGVSQTINNYRDI